MITPGTTLALVLLGASAMYGLVLFAFAKARRRMPLWWFVICCSMIGIYSLVMITVVLPDAPEFLVVASVHVAVAAAAIIAATANRFLKNQASALWSNYERIIEIGLFAVAALSLIPNLAFHGGDELRTWTVWATPYRIPQTTMMTPVCYTIISIGLINLIWLTWKTSRPILTVGAVLLAVCGGNDMAVAMNLWTFPFCGAFGAISVLIAFAIDESRQWGDEALQLADLKTRLEDRVEERSREILSINKKLAQSEKQAAMGRLAAAVGHEINNPLTYVMANLTAVISPKGSDREKLDDAIEGVQRIAGIVSQLRGLSRDPDRHVVDIDVNEALAISVKTVKHRLRSDQELQVEAEPELWIRGDRGLFTQMVINLLTNAIESISDQANSGRVWLRASSNHDQVVITVEDNGVGIPSQLQERLFEPFVTGRDGGLGLGLSIVQTIVEGLQGTIEVCHRERPAPALADRANFNGNQIPPQIEGSRFEVRIPQSRSIESIEAEQPIQLDEASSADPSAKRRVLIIDDETMILKSLEAALVDHEVTTTSDPYQGLEFLCDQRFDFVLCDLIMPQLPGLDLIENSRTKNPGLQARLVLTSGGIPSEDLCQRLETSKIEFLQKPFTTNELCKMVASTPRIETDKVKTLRGTGQSSD